jgi:hypothetical protein
MSITKQVWIVNMTRLGVIPITAQNVYVVTHGEMQNKVEI